MTLDIRRILLIAAALAGIGVGAVSFAVYVASDTAGFSQKCGGSYCWGYKLEQYRFLRRNTLTFWGTWGLHLQYELPAMNIERMNEDRWLDADRAVYLSLRFKPISDPNAAGERVRILYDFQRGDLNVASALPLWRVADFRSGTPRRNWLTDEEFDRLLIGIEP